jgi:hypothetical protein
MDHDAARSAQPGAADAWLGERAQLAQLEAELDVQLVLAWLGVVVVESMLDHVRVRL